MKLHPNWKNILQKAWSLKLMAMAGVFTITEQILPMFSDQFPRGLFAILTGLAIAGGMIARLIVQENGS